MDALASLVRHFERLNVPYVLIGGHAVNAWLEPRFTADADITVQANLADMQRVSELLAEHGYHRTVQHGAALPSGPDFVRFESDSGTLVLEVQLAKTPFQDQAVRRAIETADGLRVATAEDLIVLKLIANRPKDRMDLTGLVRLPEIDWAYVEHWASEWDVLAVLREIQASTPRSWGTG